MRAASALKEPSAPPVAHTASAPAARAEPVLLEPRVVVHRRTTIDFDRLRAGGYLPAADQQRQFAEYCHRIKRPVIDRALSGEGGEDARLILLSSALPGDGKTFISLNLALSMARERDISVLLVDGDLPKRQVSRALGMQGDSGLLDALRDTRVDAETLIFDTDVPSLEVLPAGGPAEGAAELLASARMREIAARLSSRNPRRLILFDSPPLLVSSEARALAAIPGQIVLVARVGHTPRRAIQEAIGHVPKNKLVGLVLNDAHVDQAQGYYGYSAYGEPGEAVSGQS
jgi:protein-tyrosine kinase